MISMEMINTTWSNIIPQEGYTVSRRVDHEHPLDCFIGFDENKNMQFFLLSDEVPDLPQSSQQVLVRANRRTDGKFAICFILTNLALKDTFISLCWDIITSTYECRNKKIGIKMAVKRFGMWLLLMAKAKNEKMSENVIRGMLGELQILKECAIPNYGAETAVSGWVGPLHADRDFEYENGWMEVKTVSLSRECVSISSFDQLDTDRSGELIICRIERTAETDPDAITLRNMVESIEALLEDNVNAITMFRLRLNFFGYNFSDDGTNIFYRLQGYERYLVEKDFPRIRRTRLRPEITNGEYFLSIASLQPWRKA